MAVGHGDIRPTAIFRFLKGNGMGEQRKKELIKEFRRLASESESDLYEDELYNWASSWLYHQTEDPPKEIRQVGHLRRALKYSENDEPLYFQMKSKTGDRELKCAGVGSSGGGRITVIHLDDTFEEVDKVAQKYLDNLIDSLSKLRNNLFGA